MTRPDMPKPPAFAAKRREALVRPFNELGIKSGRSDPLSRLGHRAVRWFNALTLERGLDTSQGSVELEHFHSERLWYEASGWRFLRRALPKHEVQPSDVFVDFGCGKGRVLLCAARYPFARVMGVEISARLSEVAQANIERARSRLVCQRVEVVTCDAADFDVPDDMTHAYFFHPFTGDTSQRVLRRIIDSIDRRPRRVTLIYALPHLDREVLATGRFHPVRRVTVGRRKMISNRIHVYSSEAQPPQTGGRRHA